MTTPEQLGSLALIIFANTGYDVALEDAYRIGQEIIDAGWQLPTITAETIRAAKAQGWAEARKAKPDYSQGHDEYCLGFEDCDCAQYPNPYQTPRCPNPMEVDTSTYADFGRGPTTWVCGCRPHCGMTVNAIS